MTTEGDTTTATLALDKAAAGFRRHLGSAVAAGWANFLKGDYATSLARFETALAIDNTFAETHGALAALDLIEGRLDDARRRTDVALRLDRRYFSVAPAKSLLLANHGGLASAQRVRDLVLNLPIDASSRTHAQVMVVMGRTPAKQQRLARAIPSRASAR